MSSDQTRREINQLDKEIGTLEAKRAEIDQKIANAQKKTYDIQKSITKYTSSSMVTSKNNEIQRLGADIVRYGKEKAETSRKIAEKTKKRNEKTTRLNSEEVSERRDAARSQSMIQEKLETRLTELLRQGSVRNQPPMPELNVMHEEYDVFISHAWEDKETFVDELVEELSKLDIKVWYDQERIKWGDSLREKIDEGLSISKFGIVVISRSYISKYWPKTELDGLFQLETINGKKILPIWHNITKLEVMNFSPIIGGRLALTTTTMTPSEIAFELSQLLNPLADDQDISLEADLETQL